MLFDAQSYLGQSPTQVISVAENEKKRKYLDTAVTCHAHFTPLCFSVDGVAGSEAEETWSLFICSLGEVIC